MKPKVFFLIDNSGSMSGVCSTVQYAMEKIYRDLDPSVDIYTAIFGDHYQGLKPPGQHPYIDAHSGGTSLFNSSLQILRDISNTVEEGERALCLVITDGGETLHDVTIDAVRKEVTIAEDLYGWDFLFLGTNQNANAVGKQMGIKPGKSLSFAATSQGFKEMLNTCSRVIDQWATGSLRHDDAFFTKADQDYQSKLGARA